MEIMTIILNSPPYGDEKIWNALRLAKALISFTVKAKVNIFLVGDAVNTARKGQKPLEGFYNLEKMVAELVKTGVNVSVCGTCTHARGLTEQDLVEGVQIGSMVGLSNWKEESQKVLSF